MTIQEEIQNSSNWQTTLYNRYHAKVLSTCQYFLKDREEAQDAAHDVFIKAFRAWCAFEWKCEPLTWLATIARHECFNRIQKRRKNLEQRTQYFLEENTLVVEDCREESLSQQRRFEKILPQVTGPLKEILRLSLEQGLNQREIATRMGVSRVAITRRLTRFKKDIKRKETFKKVTSMKRSTNIQFRAKTVGLKTCLEEQMQLKVA